MVLVPWEVAEKAGWPRHPNTVLAIESRLRNLSMRGSAQIKIVTSSPLLDSPEEPTEPREWTPLVIERTSEGSTSLKELLDMMEDYIDEG